MLAFLPIIFLILGLTLLALGLFLRLKKKKTPQQLAATQFSNITQPSPSPLQKTYLADLFFFFGTQSGTAEKFSNILAQEAEEQGFHAKVVDLEEYEKYDMKTKNCIFCVATTGEGWPTDNAKVFYKFLQEREQENDFDRLAGMKFAVFGLGNKIYQHYNVMGKSINRLLLKLGGELLYKYGEGDDNVSLEDDFNAWKEGIWDELKIKLSEGKDQKYMKQMKMAKEMEEFSKEIKSSSSNSNPKSGFALVPTSLPPLSLDNYNLPSEEFDFQTKVFFESNVVKLLKIEEIRQNTLDGSTLHLEIATDGKIKYRTAQNLIVIPENNDDKILEVGEYLDLDLSQTVIMEGAGGKRGKAMFPTPITIRTILKNFCDFQGIIMKRVLKDLAKIANDSETKKRLEFLASNEGKQVYKEEIESNMTTLISLLKTYKIKPTLEEFVSLCPRITPRYFTISSSNLLHPHVVHITASILKDSLPSGNLKTGLASKYFEDLHALSNSGKKPTLRIAFKPSNFVLPYEMMQPSSVNNDPISVKKDPISIKKEEISGINGENLVNKEEISGNDGDNLVIREESKKIPVVMIGGGVGVAPFRAYLQEKEFLKEKGKLDNGDMEMTLFFGCKHEEGDNIFCKEFKEFKEKGILNYFYSAYSRDQAEKVYVQHLIKKNGKKFYEDLITRKGVVYMCGSTAMGRDVMAVIENILLENEVLTQEEVKTRISELESAKRIIKEVWG